jgi:hypothetical protein
MGLRARRTRCLKAFSADRPWDCNITGADRYGRSLGNCFVEGEDVSAWMVRSAGRCHSFAIRMLMTATKSSRARPRPGFGPVPSSRRGTGGIGPGRPECTAPFGVPVNAQKSLLGAVSSKGAPSPDCVIKASVGGLECVYHLPGDRWYGKIKMDGSGKRWFCSTVEAEAAGCRSPLP